MNTSHLCLPFFWICIFIVSSCFAATDARATSPDLSPYNVVWDSPSKDHHGSMPLGNGATGVNAWIEPSGELCFYIGRTDSWGDNARLLKLGKIRIAMEPMPALDPFKQTLSLVDATMRVQYGEADDATTVELWVDANQPIIHVAIQSPKPVTASATIELWRTQPEELTSIEVSDVMLNRSMPNDMHAPTIVMPDTVITGETDRIGWYHRNVKSVGPDQHARVQDMTGFHRDDPLLHRTFGAVVTARHAERVDDTQLRSAAAKMHHFDVFVDTQHPSTAAQWMERMDAHIAKYNEVGFATSRRQHEQWWLERWNRSWIVAERSEKVSGMAQSIPANDFPFRLGMDKLGGSRLAAELGRVSIVAGELDAEEIAGLAKRPHDQPMLHQESALFSAIFPPMGEIADSSHWTNENGLTLEAWVRPTQPGAAGGRIFDKVTPGKADGMLFDTHAGLRLLVGSQKTLSFELLPSGQWTHLAAVIPADDSASRIYRNGQLLNMEQDVDDAFVVTRGYTLQRFIDIAAGRGAFPIKFNGSLFTVPYDGKPGDADYRRWGPGYWWQNTRLPYLSMCASGDTDLMAPLFAQYIDRFLPLNQYRTKHYFDHAGAYYPECVQFWGDVFNETYGWEPAANRSDKLQVSGYHKWEWVAGPELVSMALDYYDHVGDHEFLKQKVLPTADAVIAFFDQHHQLGEDGKLVFEPAQALETWWDCTNPMPEVAGLIAITDRLLALDESLTTSQQRSQWLAFRSRLPPLPTWEIDGETAFAPAQRFEAKKNVENPELYCVFPFRLASFNRPNAAWAIKALEHRWDRGHSGWRQDDLFMAYLGLTQQAKTNLVARAKLSDRAQRFPAFWGPNYDWTPDQDHGGVLMKAFQSMLMQTEPQSGSLYDDKIYLFPAWPKHWNVKFKLHAPQQTVIEGEYRDGVMGQLKVIPESRHRDVEIIEQNRSL